jgi:hypothetical protein
MSDSICPKCKCQTLEFDPQLRYLRCTRHSCDHREPVQMVDWRARAEAADAWRAALKARVDVLEAALERALGHCWMQHDMRKHLAPGGYTLESFIFSQFQGLTAESYHGTVTKQLDEFLAISQRLEDWPFDAAALRRLAERRGSEKREPVAL